MRFVYKNDNANENFNGRGNLTKKAKEVANNFLNREITTKELRLYSYINYCLLNDKKVENINEDEIEIIDKLMMETHLVQSGYKGKVMVSSEFYQFMQWILWECYVKTKMTDEIKDVLCATYKG